MKPRRYVILVLLATALAPLSTAAFNLAVDPYDFQGMLGVRAIDPNRMSLYGPDGPFIPEWYGKVFNVRWFKPDAAVFGSSSSGSLIGMHELGSDPRHRFGKRIYHFSVAGPSIGMLKHYFRHTEALSKLDQAVLELNFFMFNADKLKPDASYLARVPMAHLPDYERRFLWYMLESSVTQATTRDSLDILVRRNFPGKSLGALENEWAGILAPAQAPPATAVAPPTAMSYREQIAAVDRAIYIGLFHDRANAPFRFVDDTGYDTFDELREILAEARSRGTRLHIYLSPSHARMSEMIAYDGRWELFEEWKRKVTAVVAEDAAAHPDAPVPLWDFSGYNSVTTEPLPPEGAPAGSWKYYLDTVHFSRVTADLMVDRMFDFHEAGRVIPDDFGIRLTPANVEQVIADTRVAKARYEAARQDEIAALHAILRTVR